MSPQREALTKLHLASEGLTLVTASLTAAVNGTVRSGRPPEVAAAPACPEATRRLTRHACGQLDALGAKLRGLTGP